MNICIELKQHVGAPCNPIVNIGDEVKKGQLVAKPQGLGANIHSSVYGKVVDINEKEIVIKPFENQPEEYVKIKETDSHLEAVKEAGIVGSGGAGFPAHVKLNVDLKGGYVIANAAECEPVLSHNVALMEENPEVVVKGLKYILEMTNASKGYIAIKPKYKKAIIALGKACKNEENIEVKFLPDMYPAGDERVIIRELLGVELKPGQLPLEAKAVVSNVETLKNIVLAIEERKPVITKDITVGGRVKDAKKGRVFFDVPIGMPIKHYIEECGGYEKPYGEIVLGGPFTGKHGEEDSPVNKTLGGILVSMPFPNEKRKVGIIACECGAQEERLKEIAKGMGAEVVAETKCKRMTESNGRYRCDLPGICPGQAEKVLYLKKQGAEVVITGTCED
ncbi:proline reductase-associated electron transfer protein PrdC [Tepidibacter formicigenes DSM 15518]|jgi:proline reductase-associated electron transfer protein PrdC|uniref:Proline reductase-associated electron transfer protein PrdC n=2 Tax=Tepidibacter TaxID=214904 RepID=A0A1M6L8N7_9FIRM|nr:proline reductase-associated electron transfer protein PrdC [Tepidibacter formicigenes DSM 15518]